MEREKSDGLVFPYGISKLIYVNTSKLRYSFFIYCSICNSELFFFIVSQNVNGDDFG